MTIKLRNLNTETERKTEGQKDRKIDGQKHRYTERIERQKYRNTETDRKTEKDVMKTLNERRKNLKL